MNAMDKKTRVCPPDSSDSLQLRLYVAGDAPSSLRARVNLRILHKYLPEGCTIDYVNVLDEPLRALDDGVLVSPTLLRAAPAPALRIIGDLRDFKKVLEALGIEKDIEK